MTDCLFCSIAAGEIPADIVWSDEDVLVFSDISPQAPVHVLAIPRRHHPDAAALFRDDPVVGAKLMRAATEAADRLKLDTGYRLVFNTGADGGQTVHHVHCHVLGGRQMWWPPG